MLCRTTLTSLTTLTLLVSFAGCSDDAADESQSPPTLTATVDEQDSGTPDADTSDAGDPAEDAAADAQTDLGSPAAADGPNVYAGMRFEIPEGWQEVELSAMQRGIIAARFTMPAISEDLTLTLSRSGGSIEDNLDRWRGQMEPSQPERAETIRVAGEEASLVDLQGRFSAGFGRDPQDDWRMIGVIVPMQPQDYFIKLTGPIGAVTAVEEEFDTFLESARKE